MTCLEVVKGVIVVVGGVAQGDLHCLRETETAATTHEELVVG